MHFSTIFSLLSIPFAVLGQPTTNATFSNTTSSNITSSNTTSPIVITKVTPSYWRATFSNPPFNIQNTAWYTSLYSTIATIASDPSVKVVVWDAAPGPFWIAHFDLINGVLPEVLGAWWGNLTTLANLPVLNIAAIQGLARGGGAELAAALDVRFASREKGRLGQIELMIGAMPGTGGMDMLPRLVGRGRALEIILGADDFDAETAAAYGWINRAIPDAEFEDFVDRFARRVSSYDAYAIKQAKQIVNKRTGFPTVAEVQESEAAFYAAVSQGAVAKRLAALVGAGLQTNVDFEVNANDLLLKYQGEGPWPTDSNGNEEES